MFVIRWILGRIILLLNFVFPPKKRQRPIIEQAKIDEQTKSLALYQYAACPFCVKVRRSIRRQGLNIATVDAKQDVHKQQLVNEGGHLKVPCLKIQQDGQTQWMYESKDIIAYLSKQYA
ncbi:MULTISPECIES: glutathione S-transferase N-terminal domain-containing protein [unclassified Shewanella]|uniref:glutathione S-transferase N-terminal domain-containing protein n=1 Tax=unclassified Shewanella TaxID=196818 RepID=UPI000C82EAAF|nr:MULTISPECIES: glutathione S-transferase N-terminal domain-containing protein [unclassified Shewanella]MDO6620674.1 glutathione S-transferase N-terminal domain-containing protein [Shewanella sp. 6_MG-2023]MDO6641706.1 glutathione S-transferase N-terminal domain-containing protein [Shewanella sp. 5_MG-2023]MDO6677952.1 glutathione S-transferase N-terminal domain-containing protein [Shewanella sp. 4_MG-2023]MDO6777031.1 glutathione S-transferase N-terminal domain-containing protein [Shewanella 